MAQFSQSNGYGQQRSVAVIGGGQQRSVAVIGGGLVGSMAACFLGRRGYEVHLYEYRSDIRCTELVQGRSINLALSARGRTALRKIGLETALVEGYGIPLAARMIHAVSGATKSIPYDVTTHQAIYSVGRKHLNEVLLTGTEKYPNVHLHFSHKLVNADLNKGTVTILDIHESRTFSKSFDLVVGADGAFSAVRKIMMKEPLFGYSQTYIEHGYIELCIPPTEQGQFAMPHNYLHIWPRGEFMMIALPNQDFSWTVTLFMPFVKFGTLDNKDHLVEFFQCYFPDSVPLIGEDKLVEDFFKAKPLPLVSIKCSSYHVSDKVLIMGDAAHAMVPFYGQGMNAGFEDCLLFDTLLDQHFGDIATSLKDFSEKRKKDAHAICDLAMYNYVEMRELVNKRSFLLRKWLDDFLFWIFPRIWVPLYNSVTFTDMGYQQCVRNRQWQDMVITRFLYTISALGIAALALAFRHLPFRDVITYFRQRLDSLFL